MSFIHNASLIESGRDDTVLRRQCAAGDLVRIRPGTYVRSADWSQLSDHDRYVLRIRATMRRIRPHLVVSHDSAAALWGFPVLDSWPTRVHLVDSSRRSSQVTPHLIKHAGPAVTPIFRDGLACTPAARTATDLALARGFVPGLLGLDFGLATKLFSKPDIAEELATRARARGSSTARLALEVADAGAKSALETISRADILNHRFPRPELQKKFVGADGRTYYVDFWWEQFGIIGEADGEEKYLNARMRGPRSFERVMLDEKERDDALRALPEVKNLVRWRYKMARQPGVLAGMLQRAGLPTFA